MSLKCKVKQFLSRNEGNFGFFLLYEFLKSIYNEPFIGLYVFSKKILYCYYISYRLFGFSFLFKVYFSENTFKVKVKKQKGAVISVKSKMPIIFESFLSGDNCSSIFIGEEGVLEIDNTFYIGNGCNIKVGKAAKLKLYGNSDTQTSGITSNTIILCSKEIVIGAGTIVSWGCYISDSSQHKINGVCKLSPIIIGDHVWISEGVSISPGSIIGPGSVIASKSFVSGVFYGGKLIAGIPAKTIKDISWER